MRRGSSVLRTRLAALAGLALFLPRPLTGAAQKEELWLEVRTPHFVVISNGSERQARRVGDQFEHIRAVFQRALPGLRVDSGKPFTILAAKNEATLRTLLPEFWERRGRTHPVGIFVSDQDKDYVALRHDAPGENPYRVIYHEYMHAVLRLNYRHVPVWLDEGLAEFYANTAIGEGEASLGGANVAHLQQLQRARLLPLVTLLRADHDSPYYNEANQTSLFYAECWALVHHLVLSDVQNPAPRIATFLRLLQSGRDDLEAARTAFGDLSALQQNLEAYVRQPSLRDLRIKTSTHPAEKDYVVRPLPWAETLASRGDFHLRLSRLDDARALLQQSLRLNPDGPRANESMGFLELRLNHRAEAAKWFALAVELDAASYLAQYNHAMLLIEGAILPENWPRAEAALFRASEVNPQYAPPYAALASLYSTRRETLDKALAAAQKAAELDPTEPLYELSIGRVLLRMERIAEARAIGQSLAATARTGAPRKQAADYLGEVDQAERLIAERKHTEEEARAYVQNVQAQLRAKAEEHPTPSLELPPPETPPAAPAPTATGSLLAAAGVITEVRCSLGPELDMTLTLVGRELHLRAPNRFKLEYRTLGWQPPEHFSPCWNLKGLNAVVTFRRVAGQSYEGVLSSIEIRK